MNRKSMLALWCLPLLILGFNAQGAELLVSEPGDCQRLTYNNRNSNGELRHLDEPLEINDHPDMKVVAGGRLGNGLSLGTRTGSFGGAFRAIIEENGHKNFAVEKIFLVSDRGLIAKIVELHQLAFEAGMGPKVFGTVDFLTSGGQRGSLLYLAEVGDAENALKFQDGRPFALTVKQLKYGDFDAPAVFDAKRDYFSQYPGARMGLLSQYHPDFHENNIIVEFLIQGDGTFKPHVLAIDWDNQFHPDLVAAKISALKTYRAQHEKPAVP